MNAPQTIARSTVLAALDSLGLDRRPFARAMAVTFTSDTISIDMSNGERATWRIVDDCPSCHTHAGHAHTEYCQRPDPWTAPLDGIEVRTFGRDAVDLVDDTEQTTLDDVAGDCSLDGCPHTFPHYHRGDDELVRLPADPEPEPWVDNGCRCPNPDQHRDGCPVLASLRAKADELAQQVAAVAVHAHERDHEVQDGKGVTWHQTGPDDAHERWRCDPANCGWQPAPPNA